jgi:hypothetical protein
MVAEILRDFLHRDAIFRHAHGRRVTQHMRCNLADLGTKPSGLDAALDRGQAPAGPFDHELRERTTLRFGESAAQGIRHRHDGTDIRQDALGRRVDAEQTRSLLDGLVRAGWLKLVTEKTAGRAIHRWHVNPQLFSGPSPLPESPERPERGSAS